MGAEWRVGVVAVARHLLSRAVVGVGVSQLKAVAVLLHLRAAWTAGATALVRASSVGLQQRPRLSTLHSRCRTLAWTDASWYEGMSLVRVVEKGLARHVGHRTDAGTDAAGGGVGLDKSRACLPPRRVWLERGVVQGGGREWGS